MTPLWMAIVFLFVTGHMFSFMIEGSSGIASTALSSSITPLTLFIPISSSSGFASTDSRIFIGAEEARYDSIQSGADSNCLSPPCLVLSGDDRGLNNTTAVAHGSGVRVYTELTGLLNTTAGFRMAEFSNLDSPLDFVKVPFFVIGAIGKFVAKAVMWDYSFLEGNAVYIKFALLYPISGAFVVAVISLVRGAVSP